MSGGGGSNLRKKVFIVTLSGMTLLTISACRWQYNRYNYSIKKWKTLDEQFQLETPQEISFDSLPWENQQTKKFDIEDYEFRLVSLKGTLLKERFFVHRHSESRPGYLIVAPFTKEHTGDKTIAVNLGWIPSQLKTKFDQMQPEDQTLQLTGLVKRPEKLDYVNQQQQAYNNSQLQQQQQQQQLQTSQQNAQNPLGQQRFNSYIDLESMEEKLHCGMEQRLYLERFLLRSENANEQDLYPVVSSKQTFSKPYLTPDKHLSYCTFWGCCSAFGIYTIFKLFRM